MTLKIVNNSDPGDADHVGGNDWDQLAGIINGTDTTMALLTSPFSYVIYRVTSSSFKTLRCSDASIVYSGSIALDAFKAARDGMASNTNTGTYGGMTLIKKGIYTLSAVDANDALFDINAPGNTLSCQRYVGEGLATTIDLQPTSAVTLGIRLAGYYNGFENMRFRVNANVTDAIRVDPVTVSGSLYGILRNLRIEGWNGSAHTYMPTLTGIHLKPDSTSAPLYEWEISHIYINNMLCGINLDYNGAVPIGANNNVISHIKAGSCDYAVDCKAVSNSITHVFHQGNTTAHLGIAAVRLDTSAENNVVSNCAPELFTTDMVTNRSINAAAVILENGSLNNQVTGITNSGGDRIVDKNVVGATTWGSTNTIRSNFKNQNPTTETVGASPALIVNNGQGPRMYFITGGVITKIEIGRATATTQAFTDTGLTGPMWFILDLKEALQITYSVAPTVRSLTF